MATIQPPLELHVCMGLNACQNQGYSGANDCAGMGDCSVIAHACHTLNECRGQGGCGLFGTAQEFCFPGQNDCRYQGSCGAPILDSRFITQGPNKGYSVWMLARQRFEQQRLGAGQGFGPPPAGPHGPSNAYVNQITGQPATGNNASCGQSGDRQCSYAASPVARALLARQRVQAMSEASAAAMPAILSTCSPDQP